MGINFFCISGKLTKEPYFQRRDRRNGDGQYNQACYTIVNTQKNRDGTVQEYLFDIDVFGQNAKYAKEYLHQGSSVTVRGVIKSNTYTSRHGEKLNNPNLQVYEQDSPDIPESARTGEPDIPENSHELPERAGSVSEDMYEYDEQDYF